MATRNYRNSSRRSRTPMLILGGLGLCALMFVGIVGTLWLAGVPLNPFAQREAVEDPFMVRIPINAQPIPAYSRVDRRQLLNPADGGLMFQKVPPQAAVGMSIVGVDQNGSHVESRVESIKNDNDNVVFVVSDGAEVRHGQTFTLGGAIMNINAIIGRVVKADKRAGMGFQESTFFPKGTPEGLAGATPQGMRAITLNATLLTGVHSLGAGDQIDLLASVPVSADSGEATSASEVELLAQNAKVLRPVYVRNEVTQSASLMNGPSVSNVPKYEVAIAVAADDVIPLQNALNQELPITCVAHSMKPEGDVILATANADEVRVPVTVRPILAYAVVSRDAFVSPATRALRTETMSRQEADRNGAITSISEALGAIVRQDIPAGRYLRRTDLLKGPPEDPQEDDLVSTQTSGHTDSLPDGTRYVSMLQQPPPSSPPATAVGDRPAISSFVPPGMRAIAIPANELFGSDHLQIGDRLDLQVSYDLEQAKVEKQYNSDGDLVGTTEFVDSRDTNRSYEETYAFRGEPWFVASNAMVVGPVGFPAPAAAQRAIAGANGVRPANQRQRTQLGGLPIILAVSILDAENIAAALSTKEALFSFSLHGAGNARPGMKRIAVVPGKISRLEELNESVFLTNRRGQMERWVSRDDPRFQDAIAYDEIEHFYGRVLSRTKKRWEPFRDSDFLPPGTQPGLAATLGLCRTVTVVETSYVESLAAFEEGDRVSIVLRHLYEIADHVRYAGPYQYLPSAEVIVDDARIVRRELDTVVLEMSDSDSALFQSALAFVKGRNGANGASRDSGQQSESGTNQGGGNLSSRSNISRSIPSMAAIARPRTRASAASVNSGTSTSDLTKIPPVDPVGNLRFMQVITAGNREVYAFDGE